MSSRSTLVFVCNDPKLYGNFIAQFRFAGFELRIARNLAQAKSQLLRGPANAIVVRHDCVADDRALAPNLKRIAPTVPVFLVTDREQPGQQPGIDAVWHGDLTDDVVVRAMAVFFDRHLAPHEGTLHPFASELGPFARSQTRPLA